LKCFFFNFFRKKTFLREIFNKTKVLDKNKHFGQKSKFWTKNLRLDKNRHFGQKSEFWTKKSTFRQK